MHIATEDPPTHLMSRSEKSSSVSLSTSSPNVEELKKPEESEEPEDDHVERIKQNSLYGLFRPFLNMMRLAGMFFIPPKALRKYLDKKLKLSSETSYKSSKKEVCEWFFFENFSKFYCFAVFFLIWALGARFLYSFKFGVERLAFSQANLGNIVNHSAYAIWIVQMILTHFLLLQACWNEKKMFHLFCCWDRLHFQCPLPVGNCRSFADDFRWRRNILFIVVSCNLFIHLSSGILPLIIPYSGYSELKESVLEGFDLDNVPVMILDIVGGIYAGCVFILPSYFFLLIGMTLNINFRHLSQDLSLSIQTDGILMPYGKSLEWFRLRHNCLCKLLEVADGIFSPWILLNIGCSTVQILASIFDLYALGGSAKLLTALTGTSWTLWYILQIVLTLYTGSIVHAAAHSPLLSLYKIDQSKAGFAENLQLQTFLNKLTCSQIGFTAWKTFTINYETLLTVFGLYVTYQILLFQLQLNLGLDARVETLVEHPDFQLLNTSQKEF